jgi:group I intron endonuclease
MYHVYCIQNRANDKVYVGQTHCKPAKRFYQHRWQMNKGISGCVALQNAWNAHGGDAAFDFYELASYETKEAVNDAERFFIRWFRGCGLSYNCTGGGEGLCDITEETRAKLRGRPGFWLGKKRDEATREKFRQAKLGKKQDPEHIANRAAALREAWKVRGITDDEREQRRQANLGNQNFKGKAHSEETKQKLSEARKGEGNPMFGRQSTDAQKQAASRTWKGVKRGPMSEETKAKLREARSEQVMKPMSDETKEKIRQAKIARDLASKS